MKSKRKKHQSSDTGMLVIFLLVEAGLRKTASLLGRTYNEMNVIVYYGIIPLTWVLMLDYILSFHWFTFGFLCFVVGVLTTCGNFTTFCDRVFEKSVDFLLAFDRLGSNYTSTSVWICVAVPFLVYLVLGWLIFM